MYILVLFNEKKVSSYLAHGEGKECVKCYETRFFLKKQRKNTRLRLVEARIK